MSKGKIFISYSHTDSDWAQEFAKSLNRRGIKVWLDQSEVKFGDSLRDAIEKGLRESDLIVALINNESVKRPSLFFELGAALGMGKRIVGVVPKGFDASQLPQSLRLRRYIVKESPETTADMLVSEAA
jgi:hypothetical protein